MNQLFLNIPTFRTFHVPVVTPFELELGLGAREWDCNYLTSVVGKGLFLSLTPEEYQGRLNKVAENRSRTSSTSSSHEEDKEEVKETNTSLTVKATQTLTVFRSPAAEYLSSREYKGLDPTLSVEEVSTSIVIGQYGIASSYQPTGTWASDEGVEDSSIEIAIEKK